MILTERELYAFVLDVMKTAQVFAKKEATQVAQHLLSIIEPLGDRLHQLARGQKQASHRADLVRKKIKNERSALAGPKRAQGINQPTVTGFSARGGPRKQ